MGEVGWVWDGCGREGSLNRLACHWLVWKRVNSNLTGCHLLLSAVISLLLWVCIRHYVYTVGQSTLASLQRNAIQDSCWRINFQELVWHIFFQLTHFCLFVTRSYFCLFDLSLSKKKEREKNKRICLLRLRGKQFMKPRWDFGWLTTLNRRNKGFLAIRDLTSLPDFWKYYIYIFLRVSLLNVFVYFNSFKKILLCGVLHRDKQMKDILREAVVEKSRSCSFLLSLLKVHVIASACVRACVRVSVCAHTSRCNMELLSSAKERFDCLFFLWYWKKKTERLPCSIWVHLLFSPLTLSHSTLRFNKFVHLWNQQITVYI